MQTLEEKVEAIKTLLPCLTSHLYRNPGTRVVPEARWVSEGEPPPAHIPPPPCDWHCGTCKQTCREEGWIGEYWWLRRRYPILWALEEQLLPAMADVTEGHRWHTAIRYTYLEPCDIFAHAPWPDYARLGLEWLAGVLGDQYVPTFIPAEDAKAQERWMRARRHELVRTLGDEGLSQRAISYHTGYSQPQVQRILAAQRVRPGRVVSPLGGKI